MSIGPEQPIILYLDFVSGNGTVDSLLNNQTPQDPLMHGNLFFMRVAVPCITMTLFAVFFLSPEGANP